MIFRLLFDAYFSDFCNEKHARIQFVFKYPFNRVAGEKVQNPTAFSIFIPSIGRQRKHLKYNLLSKTSQNVFIFLLFVICFLNNVQEISLIGSQQNTSKPAT